MYQGGTSFSVSLSLLPEAGASYLEKHTFQDLDFKIGALLYMRPWVGTFQVLVVKNLLPMQEIELQSLGWVDPLE